MMRLEVVYQVHFLPCCLAVVTDIAHGSQGLSDVVVDHSIHRHSHGVLGQHLLWRNIETDGSHVNDTTLINTRDDEE